jgi:hypothetical protein
MSSPLLMDGTRFSTVMDTNAALSKLTSGPMFPLPSATAMSAQFQNSSGAEDLEVQEFVVT